MAKLPPERIITPEEMISMTGLVGRFGAEWVKYMAENHPAEHAMMEGMAQLRAVAEKVENEARELQYKLEEQYEEKYPRPTGFTETNKYLNTRKMIVERQVLEQIVFQLRTTD